MSDHSGPSHHEHSKPIRPLASWTPCRSASYCRFRRCGRPDVCREEDECPENRGARRLSHFDQLMQVFADVAPNQQGNEPANLGVGELGRHSLKACVHRGRIKHFVKLLVDSASHVLQVPADPGWILTGVKRCGTCHASNVDPSRSTYPVRLAGKIAGWPIPLSSKRFHPSCHR
jgi:hypothetical protein